jgi:hypothetical protein
VRLDDPEIVRAEYATEGEAYLRPHFARVECRVVTGRVTFAGADAVRDSIAASVVHKHLAERVPDLDRPFEATAVEAIFVADAPR